LPVSKKKKENEGRRWAWGGEGEEGGSISRTSEEISSRIVVKLLDSQS